MASFSKVLSKCDATQQMAIPCAFFGHLPPIGGGSTQYLPVVDVSGRVWRIGYYIRPEGHPKPAFQGDWHQFVLAKGLNAGDQIIFRMERDATGVPRYTIAAQKKIIKLFGEVYYGEEF